MNEVAHDPTLMGKGSIDGEARIWQWRRRRRVVLTVVVGMLSAAIYSPWWAVACGVSSADMTLTMTALTALLLAASWRAILLSLSVESKNPIYRGKERAFVLTTAIALLGVIAVQATVAFLFGAIEVTGVVFTAGLLALLAAEVLRTTIRLSRELMAAPTLGGLEPET